jgi:hypothetical protein
MDKLKPCPFCGGEAALECAEVDDNTIEPEDQEAKSWCVSCSCAAFIGTFDTEAEAIAAWNTRKASEHD